MWRRGGLLSLCLLVFVTSLYVLCYRGVTANDGVINLQECEHLSAGRGLAFTPSEYNPKQAPLLHFFFRQGRSGAIFSVLAPGLPVASAPLCWAARKALGPGVAGAVVRAVRFGSDELDAEGAHGLAGVRGDPLALWAGMINPLSTGLMVFCFFWIGLLSGASLRWTTTCALVLAFGTFVWCYAETYWTQPLALAFLLSGFLLLRLHVSKPTGWLGLLAGTLAGASALFRYESAVFATVLVLIASCAVWSTRKPRQVLAPWAGLLLPLLLLLWWNHHRFGGLFSTGSPHGSLRGLLGRGLLSRLAESIPMNLLSLNQGLYAFAPPLLVATWVGLRSWRRCDVFERGALLLAGLMFGFYSTFVMWETSNAWGPRFLVLLVPFLLMPMFRHASARARTGFLLAGAAGLLVQLVGVLVVMSSEVMRATNAYFCDTWMELFFRSEIWMGGRQLAVSGADPFWWMHGKAGPWMAGALVLLAGCSGFWGWRILASSPPHSPLSTAGAEGALHPDA